MKTLYIIPKHPKMKWTLGIKVINGRAYPYPYHLIIKRPPNILKDYLKAPTTKKLLMIEYVGHQEILQYHLSPTQYRYLIMEVIHQVLKIRRRPVRELIETLGEPHFRWREGRGIWYAINDIPKLPYRYDYVLLIKQNQATIIHRDEIHNQKRKWNKQPIKRLWKLKNLLIVSTF